MSGVIMKIYYFEKPITRIDEKYYGDTIDFGNCEKFFCTSKKELIETMNRIFRDWKDYYHSELSSLTDSEIDTITCKDPEKYDCYTIQYNDEYGPPQTYFITNDINEANKYIKEHCHNNKVDYAIVGQKFNTDYECGNFDKSYDE